MELKDILDKIEEVGSLRGMDNSDIQAIKESLKHLEKKVKINVDIYQESVYIIINKPNG